MWGLRTWAKTDVTVIINPNRGVTQEAVAAVEQAVEDWNRAIHARYNPSPFHLVLISEGSADITIKPKKGGGMIAGQAQCDSAGGFFTTCKISVSGQAFGSTSSFDTILSITLQELGHTLGLLHSDNPADVMFGTLQSTPNTVISECNIDTWTAVMHWLVVDINSGAHIPHVSEVDCGDTGDPPGDPVTGTLDVAVATDAASYVSKDRVHIFVTVKDDKGSLVAGAAVHIRIVTPNPRSDRVGDFTSGSDGVVHTHYKVNAGRDGTGTYHVITTVTMDEANGACAEADPCHADFTVS